MTSRFLSRLCISVVFVLVIAWGVGFLSFVETVSAYQEPLIDDHMEATEAVVVLTGGSERIMAGLNLLRAGKTKKLLISGVHPSVKIGSLLPNDESTYLLKECCIVLGREADNTIGNASEAHAFMIDEGFRTLRLVTANYHMPRSLLAFNTVMPDIKIIPNPVFPDSVDLSFWWKRPGTLSLLAYEYSKYLFALVRLSV